MIALPRLNPVRKGPKKRTTESGMAIFAIAIILLIASSLIILLAANNSIWQQRTTANQNSNYQAFFAADAGLQYAEAYLNQNSSAIIASANLGLISYTIGPTTLTNGASYTAVITNAVVSTYNLMNITSTGTSADGTATRVLAQQVYSPPSNVPYSVMSVGNVTFVGGSTLTNTINNQNVKTGGTFTINNGAYTVTQTGTTTTQGNIKADVQQNVGAFSSLSESSFFQEIFNTSESTLQSAVQAAGNYYNNAVSGGDYSQTLSGQTGKTIWITQSSVSLGQGVTIGSPLSPVTLIVEGDLTIANGVTFYGFVYTSSPDGFNVAGGAKIYGAMASTGPVNISNGFQLIYQTVPAIAGGGGISGTYSKVTGSWRDF